MDNSYLLRTKQRLSPLLEHDGEGGDLPAGRQGLGYK